MAQVGWRTLAGVLALGGLAACGGGGGGGGDGPGRFDALDDRADALFDAAEDVAATDPSTLPTTGTASYEGVIRLDVAAIPNDTLQEADMAGDLDLTVNFASSGDPVTGQATNFVGADDQEYSGALIIDEGVLNREADPLVDDAFTAGMAGELTGEDGTTWDMNAVLGGSFAGEDQGFVLGDVASGSACRGGTDCSGLGGDFVAER